MVLGPILQVDASLPLPFHDGTFDAIIHLPGRPGILAEWHRVLKDGGALFTDSTVVTENAALVATRWSESRARHRAAKTHIYPGVNLLSTDGPAPTRGNNIIIGNLTALAGSSLDVPNAH